MYRATKIFKFSAAHILESAYSKECMQYHGHNYKVEVCVASTQLNPDGMVLDFKLLKEIVDPIINNWDHKLLVSENMKPRASEDIVSNSGTLFVPFNPTAENMAAHIYKKMDDELHGMLYLHAVHVKSVRVWETETCYAECVNINI